jgi:hypothetical protein
MTTKQKATIENLLQDLTVSVNCLMNKDFQASNYFDHPSKYTLINIDDIRDVRNAITNLENELIGDTQ